jgi:hypothetical protein
MDDLRILRDKWAEIEAEETRLLRRMTVAESLHEARVLYDAYAAQPSEDSVELREHEAAIIATQRQLVRLAEWLRVHPSALAQEMS